MKRSLTPVCAVIYDENEQILVMHLSNRHTITDAQKAINTLLPSSLSSRIIVLPNDSPFKALQEKYKQVDKENI